MGCLWCNRADIQQTYQSAKCIKGNKKLRHTRRAHFITSAVSPWSFIIGSILVRLSTPPLPLSLQSLGDVPCATQKACCPFHFTQHKHSHTHTRKFQTRTLQIPVLRLSIIHLSVSHCTLKLGAIWIVSSQHTQRSAHTVQCTHISSWTAELTHSTGWIFIISIARWGPCELSNATAQWCQLKGSNLFCVVLSRSDRRPPI